MLMTEYSYKIEHKEDGCYITVTRLEDSAERNFFLAGGRTDEQVRSCMDVITDDQAGDYFPKEKQEKVFKEPKAPKTVVKAVKPPKSPKEPKREHFLREFKNGALVDTGYTEEQIAEKLQSAMVEYHKLLEEYTKYKELHTNDK